MYLLNSNDIHYYSITIKQISKSIMIMFNITRFTKLTDLVKMDNDIKEVNYKIRIYSKKEKGEREEDGCY